MGILCQAVSLELGAELCDCLFSANAWDDLHIWAGHASGALILARVAWGVFGAPYARFSQFVRSPRSVLAYLKAIARGGEQRYVGHNPAGGAMVVALILDRDSDIDERLGADNRWISWA